MNREVREQLREEIDALTRQSVIAPKRVGCAGCGCHLDAYVDGCLRCYQRRKKRDRDAARRTRQTA